MNFCQEFNMSKIIVLLQPKSKLKHHARFSDEIHRKLVLST